MVEPDTVWTVQKAVYGLRCAPRAWGLYRDKVLRGLKWNANGMRYHFEQCVNDPQVWKIIQIGKTETICGLLCVYVDDFLLTAEEGAMQDGLAKESGETLKMTTYVTLTPEHPITFLGMEVEMESKTGDLLVHQQTFVRQMLTKHGIDTATKSIAAIQKAKPETTDGPPTPTQLKELQGFASEFTWFATRTRTDLSYLTSVIASAATKYANWSLQLCKKRFTESCRKRGCKAAINPDGK